MADPSGGVLPGVTVTVTNIETGTSRAIVTNEAGLFRAPLLRLGTYELHHTDVPVGVCLSEAVELAKRYSTEDSHRFVNGVLAAVARDARRDEA